MRRSYLDLSSDTIDRVFVEYKPTIHDEIKSFRLDESFCREIRENISEIDDKIPNSMHRFVFIL